MSVEKLSWALRQCVKPASKKLVLIALGDCCPSDGLAFPSTETIVRTTSLDRKTVVKCLDSLQSEGLIIDTGNRAGATNQIKVFKLNDGSIHHNGRLQPNHPEIGMLPESKAPVFPYEGSQKRDTKGSQKRDTERKEELEDEHKVLPEKFQTGRMVGKWGTWQEIRRGMRKPKNWSVLFNEQLEWLSGFDEPTAFEILSASIRNGWQGLFPPKQNGSIPRQTMVQPPLFAQQKILEEAIQKHKANRESASYNNPTDSEKQDLRNLRMNLKRVKSEQLNSIIQKLT